MVQLTFSWAWFNVNDFMIFKLLVLSILLFSDTVFFKAMPSPLLLQPLRSFYIISVKIRPNCKSELAFFPILTRWYFPFISVPRGMFLVTKFIIGIFLLLRSYIVMKIWQAPLNHLLRLLERKLCIFYFLIPFWN